MKKGILAAFVAALALTAEIYAQTNDTGNMETKERIYGSVFPRGEKLPEMFAKYFTGQAYLARLTRDEALNCPVSNVTFEPGLPEQLAQPHGRAAARRRERSGVLSGEGRTCAGIAAGRRGRDRPRRGALARRGPRQLVFAPAVETNPQTNRNTWLEPVDDAQYAAATAPAAAVGSAAGRRGAPQPCGTFLGRCLGTGGDGPEINRNF